MKKIIGLIGYIGAGKDATFVAAQKVLGADNCHRIAFADSLKEEIASVLGITVDEINQNKPRYRLMLQWWGTEWRRQQDPNYWVEQARKKIDAIPNGFIFLTDCRFANEIALVKNYGGKMIKVVRPGVQKSFDHSSEAIIDAFEADYVLKNDCKLEALDIKIRYLLEKMYA